MAMKKDELVARDLAAQGKAIQLGTSDGDVEITEDDLAKITDEQLAEFEISRKELHRVFAEGVRLMQSRGVKPSHRARPVADQRLDGKWEVDIVGYSPISDPLMGC
jgi:hypothetical protein